MDRQEKTLLRALRAQACSLEEMEGLFEAHKRSHPLERVTVWNIINQGQPIRYTVPRNDGTETIGPSPDHRDYLSADWKGYSHSPACLRAWLVFRSHSYPIITTIYQFDPSAQTFHLHSQGIKFRNLLSGPFSQEALLALSDRVMGKKKRDWSATFFPIVAKAAADWIEEHHDDLVKASNQNIEEWCKNRIFGAKSALRQHREAVDKLSKGLNDLWDIPREKVFV